MTVPVYAEVSGIRRFAEAGTWIDLAVPDRFPPPAAGQFVQISCRPDGFFRLNRPFSICSWRKTGPSGGELGILFSVVGDGSRWLDDRRPGDRVVLLGPLGRPFRVDRGRVPILIGGGRGVAPILLLADQIAPVHREGLLFYGARDGSALFPTDRSPFPVHRATLDGSAGRKGTVLDLLEERMRSGEVRPDSASLYGCGPLAMLEALSRLAGREGMPVQVSLETVFGCGTGLCAGCAVPLRSEGGIDPDPSSRYAFACTEGPVFDGSRVDWREVRG